VTVDRIKIKESAFNVVGVLGCVALLPRAAPKIPPISNEAQRVTRADR
jgi:hypothetical protein